LSTVRAEGKPSRWAAINIFSLGESVNQTAIAQVGAGLGDRFVTEIIGISWSCRYGFDNDVTRPV
jgi:hypothetical protein